MAFFNLPGSDGYYIALLRLSLAVSGMMMPPFFFLFQPVYEDAVHAGELCSQSFL